MKEDKFTIREHVFVDIPRAYEPINKAMSFGTDVLMRWLLSHMLPSLRGKAFLEVGVGTGEQFTFLVRHHRKAAMKVGLDSTPAMLNKARKKVPDGMYVIGDAEFLPFRKNSFRVIASSFFIRYYTDYVHSYQERWRILEKHGITIDLDMGKDTRNRFYPFVKFYIQEFMPRLGSVFAFPFKAGKTYLLIKATHEELPALQDIELALKKAGFFKIRSRNLFFGIAMMFWGIKH